MFRAAYDLKTVLCVCVCVTSTLSCVGEDEVDEFSCLLEDEELSSTLRTR